MVVDRSNVDHIMRGLQSTEGVRLHNHRKKLRQRFDIIKKLGQGTYGKVQLGINKETGQEVAIKTIKKCKIETEADLVRIRREIQIMSSVRHPNIIHIYEVFENREKIVLVMEYAAGGELYDYLSERKVLEETEARRIFRQISTAIYYCHKHKICHRDLKLENILLDEQGSAKIADFGLSNVFDGQQLLSTYCGSPLYASPEIVKGTPYHGPEVDCWSLGVLLYTLVYGAMPFDGSNFKRLVKQISHGDYFEPKKPSSASPLIREMLTVNSPDRATIEQICSHWWVNQGFNVSCLDIAEDLANQTPVRLDLLLSLAPPPENTEKIVVTDDQRAVSHEAPPRSMSVGSFMELDGNAEERVKSFVAREVPSDQTPNEKTMKRKLEPVPSKSFSGARKKERTKPNSEDKKTVSCETEKGTKKIESNSSVMDVDTELNKSEEKVGDQKIDVKENEPPETMLDVSVAESDNLHEKLEIVKPELHKTESIAKDKSSRKSVKVVKKKDPEPQKKQDEHVEIRAKVKKNKTESMGGRVEEPKDVETSEEKVEEKDIKKDEIKKVNEHDEKDKSSQVDDCSTKLVERRRSKIFETAEKFMGNDQKKVTQEKPKKVYIPGVKVSDFAKAFERRSSIPTSLPLKSSPSKKTVSKESSPSEKKVDAKNTDKKSQSPESKTEECNSSQLNTTQIESVGEKKAKIAAKEGSPEDKPKLEQQEYSNDDEKLKDSARNVIANALVEEEIKKIKKQVLKPPVPRTKTEDLANKKKNLTLQIGKETATVQVHTPENTKFLFEPEPEGPENDNKENVEKPKEKKTTKMEITLKSNTLPRRTTKTEVCLGRPQEKTELGNFRTEIERRVGDPSHIYSTQRSEVAFPVSAASKPIRSMSLEPEGRIKPKPTREFTRERIIPIEVEGSGNKEENEARDRVKELDRPQEGKAKHPYQRTWSLRSNSLSRQSTQDSDTESTMSATGEPIKKSPREFIIPIAVEGGGYVTPRATSLEPSESMSKRNPRPFPRKFSLWSDSGAEDESPFSTLQRHSSRDFEEPFRLHRLRSSRPARSSTEKPDSCSGSEEEEDDDGFELLTAENLFSTLLSRVRSLTQRLNVEDGLRPGFPTPRLLSNHFGPSERLFSNFHQPMTRLSEREFGRSLSRNLENGVNRWNQGDLASSENNRSSIPRGNAKCKCSESDVENTSESGSVKQTVNAESNDEKRVKEYRRHSRTKSVPENVTDSNGASEYVTTSGGNKSLYVPNSTWATTCRDKENLGDSFPSKYRSGIPKLRRPSSLMLERNQNSVDKEDAGEDTKMDGFKGKDFYDILAEKYGIRNVKRYDLPPERRVWGGYIADRQHISSVEKREDNGSTELSVNEETIHPDDVVVTPSKGKKEESTQEKYKAPSEKLAAVLDRLEGKPDKTIYSGGENSHMDKSKSDVDSSNSEELHKELKLKKYEILDFICCDEKGKGKLPTKKVSRHQSDMSLKEFEHSLERERSRIESNFNEAKPPEKSVLSKYLLHYNIDEGDKAPKSSIKPRKRENVEGVSSGEGKEESPVKSKLLTSLERKLERLRTTSEKKYVDKAIRSLRESSLGPKDISENALIKRAVSISDCPSYKSCEEGKVRPNVSSVIGMLKKFENQENSRESEEEKPSGDDRLKTTLWKRSEIKPPKIELPEPSSRNLETFGLPCSLRGTRSVSKSHSPAFDESTAFLSPDSESFDSWSVCSDLGNSDDVIPKTHPKYGNIEDISKESVSERIRRKSFYTRFNERKKPRRSYLFSRSYDPELDAGEGKEKLTFNRSFSAYPCYSRSLSNEDGHPRKTFDEARPRPFYKSQQGEDSVTYWKNFDTTRNPFSRRSTSQSPSPGISFTLPRNFSATEDGRKYRSKSVYGTELERSISPVRFNGAGPHSPSTAADRLDN